MKREIVTLIEASYEQILRNYHVYLLLLPTKSHPMEIYSASAIESTAEAQRRHSGGTAEAQLRHRGGTVSVSKAVSQLMSIG